MFVLYSSLITNMENLYYTPPSDEVFEEMKAKSIALWNTYDNSYGYATEKVARIKYIHNVSDNFMYMLAMFDHVNQRKIKDELSEEAIAAIDERAPNHEREMQEAINYIFNPHYYEI